VTLEHRRGTVADLHGLDPLTSKPDLPRLLWCDPIDAAVVLGSRQRPEDVDAERCARAGLSIVRRRSGGGAVIVEPDAVVWADIVLPHGVAPDDVRGSMVWAGARWRAALAAVGVAPLDLHRGPMVCTEWSYLVCFAGLGPGELLQSGSKLVGLSQRRSRNGLRIQATLYRRPPTVDLGSLFAVDVPATQLPQPLVADTGPVELLIEALAAELAAATG
jgi:lipoate-protein ligase A